MSCGAGKIGDWLVPDLGMKLRVACGAHDRFYGNPEGPDRLDCDWQFLELMLMIVRCYSSKRRRVMFWIVVGYYAAVRVFGGRAFRKARAKALR